MVQVLEPLHQEIESILSRSEDLEIKILTGELAYAQIKIPSFLLAWEELYMKCAWGTVSQSPAFVKNWYEIYAANCNPVLVIAYDKNELVGLLPFTHLKTEKILLGAGLGTAEYHTWLATETHATSFIQQALHHLFQAFPSFHINFYNITPNSPISWSTSDPFWRKRTVLKTNRRLLMDLRDQEVDKIFRKKQFREKTNRLKRLGNLKFEKVVDVDYFKAILDELIAQSDFRKGAKFNMLQFEEDRFGREFMIKLFEEGILHTTVLSLDGKILSSIAALHGKHWVHLAGLNTHTPLLAKHSPGTINFIMLGQLLREEGVHYFDLTPGGDAYKERLANTYDFVHDLFFASPFISAKRKYVETPLLTLIKYILRTLNKSPREFKFEATKAKSRMLLALKQKQFRKLTLGYVLRGEITNSLALTIENAALTPKVKIRHNQVEDLLLYQAEDGVNTRWDYLSDAMTRFEAGQSLYTVKSNNILIGSVWLTNEIAIGGNAQSTIDLSGINLSGLHCHRDYLKDLPDFIHSVVTYISLSVQDPKLKVRLAIDERATHILNSSYIRSQVL